MEPFSMSALNWFLLGAMFGWTPSLLVLAWLIVRAPLEAEQEASSDITPTTARSSASLANLDARLGMANRSESKQPSEKELTASHVDG
jgi:hypothetical protein